MASEVQWPPAGWYPDPAGRFPQRHWDGMEWSSAVLTGNQTQATDQSFVTASRLDAPAQPPPAVPHAAFTPNTTGARATRYTALTPELAARQLVSSLQLPGNISITHADASTIEGVLRVRGTVNWVIGVVLLFIYIIPGIAYILWAQREKQEPFRLILTPETGGSRVALQCGPGAHALLTSALVSLPM